MPNEKLSHTRSKLHIKVGDTGTLSTKKLEGRDCLVAPVIMFVEGVHNGEFISFEEMSLFPESWDGIPLPIDHPQDSSGEAVTANSPEIIESSVIGRLFNVVARKDIRGISGEVWIDIEKANTVPGGAEVLRKLNAGEPLEVSTAYYCFTDNLPGEWKNPRNGTVEKFVGSQRGLRPDHLAMLPFDLGACSWEDGCGAGRTNSADGVKADDHTLVLTNSTGEIMAEPTKKLEINGKQLGRALTGMIAVHAGVDGNADAIKDRLAIAAGIDRAKLNALVEGTLDFVPRSWLNIFAAVLDVDGWDLFMAAGNDNADARHSENNTEKSQEISATPVTIPNNTEIKSETETPVLATETHEECAPCQKSLKVKVQEILKSIGLRWNEGDEKEMEKKVRVDALIASDKTQFSENHRDWLMAMNDEQLALFLPVEVAAPVAETPAVAEAAPAVNAAPAAEIKATVTKEDVLAALGVSAEDILAVKQNADAKKAARAAKIDEIAALENCPYDKAELATFSDTTLDKTLTVLQSEAMPYRAAPAGKRANDANTVPAPPSIMLAPVGKESK